MTEKLEDLIWIKQDLQSRLEAAEEALRAIQSGEVDALVIYREGKEQIYTLEGADHTYRMMVEKIQEGVATLQVNGVILYANQRLAEMLAVPLENLLGSTLLPFMRTEEEKIFGALLHRGVDGSSKGEMTLHRADGLTLPVLLTMNCVETQGECMICLVATDLTEQKRHEEILAAERLARSILEQAAESIVVCDTQGMIIRASQATYAIVRDNPLFQPFEKIFPLALVESEQPSNHFSIGEVLRGRSFQGIEVSLADGPSTRYLLVSTAPLRSAREEIIGCIVTLADITDRKQSEQRIAAEQAKAHRQIEAELIERLRIEGELRSSQERLLMTAEAAEIGMWEWDILSNRLTWDERCKAIFDLPEETILTDGIFLQAVNPEDRPMVDKAIRTALTEHSLFEVEFCTLWRDGSVHWIYTKGNSIYSDTGDPVQMFGVALDITRRKAIEAEIHSNQAHIEVQHRLIAQREQERQQIARDLHDGPLQELIGIRFALHEMQMDNIVPEVSQQLVGIQGVLMQQINELRDYAGHLRPNTLIEFGLLKAIQSHLEGIRERHPEIHFHLEGTPKGPLLPEETNLALFRITQEAVNNILKHAQATEVIIRFWKKPDQAILEIQDDGLGFDVPRDWLDLARQKHLGLVGMRERAEAMGGTLEVASKPGNGAKLRVVIPRVSSMEGNDQTKAL